MKFEVKKKIIKITISLIIIAFITTLVIYLFPVIKNLSTTEGQIEFKNLVHRSGFLGFLILFGLQLAQVFIAILPGEPMEVLAGMCYGGIGGTIFIMGANLVISTAIFLLVRKYGKQFIYFFFNQDKVDKIFASKIFSDVKRVEITMLFLFIVPGTPKDLLIYIAGLLPIDPIKFLIVSNIARFPSIISSTLVGDNIVMGNFEMCIIIYLITFVFTGAMYIILTKFDKNRVIKEATKVLK